MSSVVTPKIQGITSTLGQVSVSSGHTFRVNGVLQLMHSSTGALQLPSGTTAQRPSTPAAGYMRWNTDLNQVEVYDSVLLDWVNPFS